MDVASAINIFDPAFKANAFPVYARVRAMETVTRLHAPNGNPFWLILGYDVAQTVLKDHRRFANDYRTVLTEEELKAANDAYYGHLPAEDREDAIATDRLFSDHLLGVDPPQHSRLRKLVSQSFTPKFVEGLWPRIQQLADTLLDDLESHLNTTGNRQFDLLEHYAFPLPITVISEMLGIPGEDRDRFRQWSNAVLELNPQAGTNPEAMESLGAFAFYLMRLANEKRQTPGDDLFSGLLQAEEEGDVLSEQELIAMIFLLIVAGHETTVNLIGNGMLAFFEHPDQLALFKADPQRHIKPAIEEILRFYGPVEMSLARYAREDLVLGGQQIRRGEPLNVMIAAADRDPELVDNPERFDITRAATRHLGFGTGNHACLGAPLARMEGQIALPSLVARFPEIRLAAAPKELVWRLTGITAA
ncbi:MAG: cytochrome P450 [Chloroflexia bacterium]|nr:cytochrome P450 [Chloroflexia bacterium]MDQ3410759.1 cytochrome P450 [Chloroflexota bacterium]